MDNKITLSDFENDETLLPWDQLFSPDEIGLDELQESTQPTFSPLKRDPIEELPEKDQAYWEKLFNETNFPGMDLMAVSYFGLFNNDLIEQHAQLKRLIRDFVRLLSYNYVMDLRSAGISEEAIFYMKKGKIPENYTVHLKYPLEYGGTLDFNNLVLIQDKPFHDMIHSYINQQMVTPKGIKNPPLLYVPVPVGKVYIPFSLFTGSGGKNKQDRSVYAGFSKAAFEKIALKSMPGR